MSNTSSRMMLAFTLGVMLPAGIARADSVPLRYDPALVEKGFPSPEVPVALPGQSPAVFLVDTGASIHTLASWYVEAAGLKAVPVAGSARGSTGGETSIQVVRKLALKLEGGGRLALPEALVVEFPPMFAQLRIAGLLSPQLLAPAGKAAILDLRSPSLSFDPFQKAVDRLAARPSMDGRVCVDRDSEFRNRAYSLPIQVADREASVVLDSGATSTVIAAESAAGKALAPHGIEGKFTRGIGGEAEPDRHVPAVEIRRGGAPVSVDLNLGKSPGPACGPDGLLGMDALRECLLVLGDTALAISCAQ